MPSLARRAFPFIEREMWLSMKNELFSAYPDIVSIKQLCEMLGGIGPKAAYQLLHEGNIQFFKIGKAFRIPKRSVIDFIHGKRAI